MGRFIFQDYFLQILKNGTPAIGSVFMIGVLEGGKAGVEEEMGIELIIVPIFFPKKG
jgi:hypothetical protein